MTIGERIKELRAEANLRQSELGKAIGFSGQVVSNVERGYSFPSTEFVNLQDMLLRIRKKFPQCKQEQKPVWLSCR